MAFVNFSFEDPLFLLSFNAKLYHFNSLSNFAPKIKYSFIKTTMDVPPPLDRKAASIFY